MTTLSFFKKSFTRKSKPVKKDCDLWIRNSVNAKNGNKVKYLAMPRVFVESGPIQIKGMGPNFNCDVAIDVRSRVLVTNVSDTSHNIPDEAFLNFKARSKTAYYHANSALVDALVNEFKLDTSATNHYFKLVRDGEYFGCPRYVIHQIHDHENNC